MRQRGRKGIAQTDMAGALTVVSRPDAPLELTPEETEEWHAIVDALPADWFQRETWPLLVQFCRHTVAARRIAQLIDAEMAKVDLPVMFLKELLTMQRGET